MNGFTVYYTDGGMTRFPDGGASAKSVVDWYRTASERALLTLRTDDGREIHVLKRSISRVEVDPLEAP